MGILNLVSPQIRMKKPIYNRRAGVAGKLAGHSRHEMAEKNAATF